MIIDSKLLASMAPKIIDGVINLLNGIADDIKQALKDDINTYIGNFVDKYSKIKTFLFSEERRDFYDVYFPLSLKGRNKEMQVPDNPDKLFAEHNFITLLGHAGCGKTMVLRHLFLSACNKSCKIPLVIELRKLKGFDGSFKDFVADNVFKFKLSQNEKIFNCMLKTGKFMFLLDGYDEIAIGQKEVLTHSLEKFFDCYPLNSYLLTSRPGANAETLERFENYHVCKLSDTQVFEFIDKQLLNGSEEDLELASKIKALLYESKNNSFIKYMSSPLLLSMFILTYNEHPELPKHISSFYYNVFDTLHSKHDAKSKAGGYQHDKKSKLSQDEIRLLLEAFCFISYMQSTYEFSSEYLHAILPKIIERLKVDCTVDDIIYDLSVAISILIQDGTSYVFPHRSLQEYFAASYIAHSREEVKEKIYSEKLIKAGRAERVTFWRLCEELDSSCFLQYFVIQSLEIYFEELTKMNDKSLSLSANIFFNFLDLTTIDVAKSDNKYFLFRIENFWEGITQYVNVENLIIKKLSVVIRDEKEKLALLFVENKRNYFDCKDKSKDVLEFYEGIGIYNVAEEYKKSLEKKIKEKKELLASMLDDSDALIDLI